MTDNDFYTSLQSLTDKQLIESIQLGEKSFQAGYYSYYLNEAERRNLEIIIKAEVKPIKNKKIMIKIPRILKAWIIFTVLYTISQLALGVVLLAIFGKDIRYGEEKALFYTKLIEYISAFLLGFIIYYLSLKWYQRKGK